MPEDGGPHHRLLPAGRTKSDPCHASANPPCGYHPAAYPRLDGKGMVLALEILIGTLPVANLIRDGKVFQIPSLMQTREPGMQIMDDALFELHKGEKSAPRRLSQSPAARIVLNHCWRGKNRPAQSLQAERRCHHRRNQSNNGNHSTYFRELKNKGASDLHM